MYDVGHHVFTEGTTRYADEQRVGDLAKDQRELLHADPDVWLETEDRWNSAAAAVTRQQAT